MSQIATSILTSGLRNAYAMENGALERLERQAARLGHYPEIAAQIQRHFAETGRQLERLQKCLDALGTDPSDNSSVAPPGLDSIASDAGVSGSDEILRDAFASLAFENYEIAAYKSLLTLCEMAIQRSIAPLLQDSLDEEEAMARWLKENLSRLTRDYVSERERTALPERSERMKEIKPPLRDTGGQRGQGDQRDHGPPSKKPDKAKDRAADEPRGK
jgi:ferritin-like metal-binding protein YciE